MPKTNPAKLAANRAWAKRNRATINRWKREHPESNRIAMRQLRCRPDGKLAGNMRTRIWAAIRKGHKSARTMELIGCSIKELMLYLEAKFLPGMGWGNYGDWHVDHIRPCALFDLKDAEQQRTCFHFSNLQPLWALDNAVKGGR